MISVSFDLFILYTYIFQRYTENQNYPQLITDKGLNLVSCGNPVSVTLSECTLPSQSNRKMIGMTAVHLLEMLKKFPQATFATMFTISKNIFMHEFMHFTLK